MKKLWTHYITMAIDAKTFRAMEALAKARKISRSEAARDFVVDGLDAHYGNDWRRRFAEEV